MADCKSCVIEKQIQALIKEARVEYYSIEAEGIKGGFSKQCEKCLDDEMDELVETHPQNRT